MSKFPALHFCALLVWTRRGCAGGGNILHKVCFCVKMLKGLLGGGEKAKGRSEDAIGYFACTLMLLLRNRFSLLHMYVFICSGHTAALSHRD